MEAGNRTGYFADCQRFPAVNKKKRQVRRTAGVCRGGAGTRKRRKRARSRALLTRYYDRTGGHVPAGAT